MVIKLLRDRNNHLIFNNNETVKTLGMLWNRNVDKIAYSVKEFSERETISKRTILSCISKLFDPLGLVSPCIILVKILIQKLWVLKLTWDEPVRSELETIFLPIILYFMFLWTSLVM